jgi:TolA-binding protein
MPNESRARELPAELEQLTQLAHDSLGYMPPELCLRGELALEPPAPRARRAWRGPRIAIACATLAACAALFIMHQQKLRLEPLSYVIENAKSAVDTSLDVANGPPRMVRFSDGTEVRVDQGTEARIRFVTDHGAALAMTHGALHASVIHSATSEWRFDAGPFVVQVTGTAFGLSWDPARDRFDLRLEHGSVTVTGPVANEPIPVRGGQWLTIRPRSNEVFIRELTAAAETSDEPQAPASAAVLDATDAGRELARDISNAPAESTDIPAEPRVAPPTAHTWAQDLARGNADQVVNDALARGLDESLAQSSGSELSALADAARYTRRDAVARKALLAERRRFAGSRMAVDAGLLLGRLAESEHADGEALRWFDTYLAEAPSGAHASEALGRKMAVVQHSGNTAAARAVAEEYLARYPNGTYFSAARAISNHP